MRASWPVILARPRAMHAQDAPLDAADGGPGLDLDRVGVHGGAAVAGRDVDVLGLVVGDDEAVAGGVNLDPTGQSAGRQAREPRAGGMVSNANENSVSARGARGA